MTTFDALKARLRAIALSPVRAFARGLSTSPLGFALPLAAFAGLTAELTLQPQHLAAPIPISLKLPSEDAIPALVPVRTIDENDQVWRFRYAETGTEFRSGIPYWIFRVMPRIFTEELGGQGYEHFGFFPDDSAYYSSYPVPRGMALSDTNLRSSLFQATFMLKRVSINCSGCHRGEYLDGNGERVLQDGMPNHTANLQAFKRFYASAFQSPKFTPDRVIEEINRALAEGKHAPLRQVEEYLYRGLVYLLKQSTRIRVSAWMDPPRADNGPGRIDPFNAVKFEVLGVPDDHTVATLDFPSVWNQSPKHREWHHSDGNTKDSSARNFGSVIGVGGIPESVAKKSVNKIGDWLDELPPPPYPFAKPVADGVARGKASFERACASCHGLYNRDTNVLEETAANSLYMKVDLKVGTDPERWKAFLPGTATALNAYGVLHTLWPEDAFRGSANPGGYLNGPLDGIWARAPYLHNGSVPTIAELLKAPGERAKTFYRGSRIYDQAELGWVWRAGQEGDRSLFAYDTSLVGNSNEGHPYTVAPEARADLIEYLKTL